MTYIGIDYGMGISNRDAVFHFGVISQHTPSQWIWDDFEGVYWHGCPECETEFDDDTKLEENEDGEECCPTCGHTEDDDSNWYGDEAMYEKYNNSDPNYEISYSETLNCFFVEKSPYFTKAVYCSPCAPGAADLDSPNKDGVDCYCLGADFFDKDSPCPYPIYSVETGELISGKWEEDEDGSRD